MNIVDYVQQFPLRTFESSELLLQKGDSLEYIMAIREGFVKITSISETGVERLLWIAGRYDVVPTEQLFSKNAKVRYFYTALTKGSFYAVDKADFIEKALTTPTLMTEIARGMSSHYDDFLQHIDAVDTATVKEKLLRTLKYLADRLSGGSTVDLYQQGLRLTHQDLASMIGSTRETTSLMLSDLRKENMIEYDRKKFIVRSDAILERLEGL